MPVTKAGSFELHRLRHRVGMTASRAPQVPCGTNAVEQLDKQDQRSAAQPNGVAQHCLPGVTYCPP
ncbi:MAG TPA: hypothetical protein VFE41_01750 [Acetobacteraceae bacterium]|nr:hypothetical protein [Acetobacteraceae bacterium]